MKKSILIILFIPVLLILLFIGTLASYLIYEKTITSEDPNDFKYPVGDLFYSKYVEAASFIDSGEFEPKYCQGRIDKRIRLKPKLINPNEKIKLIKLINIWLVNVNYNQIENSLMDNINYEYSHLINREPLDCYSLAISKELKVYFRIDHENIVYGGISEYGWIINSCD